MNDNKQYNLQQRRLHNAANQIYDDNDNSNPPGDTTASPGGTSNWADLPHDLR